MNLQIDGANSTPCVLTPCVLTPCVLTPCVLTIGGLDPSGGAGIPADTRAIRAFGAHACAIATAIVAQNTRGVAQLEAVSAQMLDAQLTNLLSDIAPRAAKIGLISNVAQIEILLRHAALWNKIPLVLDPVFAPSAGAAFSDSATVRAIAETLFSRCFLVTPNALEASQLCGFAVEDVAAMKTAARVVSEKFGANRVLVKGGHIGAAGDESSAPSSLRKSNESAPEIVDILLQNGEITELRAPRIAGVEVRGTGCLLASAIAAQLAQNIELESAVRAAKSWLSHQIEGAQQIGGGRRVAV